MCLCLIATAHAVAADKQVNVLALFENKAILHIDGERRLLAAGESSPEGVVLISADPHQAVVEFDGKREILTLGTAAIFPATEQSVAEPSESISLWADPGGSFYADGSINGYPVRFLVDTGASTVAISSALARRIGIDIAEGQPWLANTAGGTARMIRITLDRVQVGTIDMRDVEAGVILGSHPTVPLLGMSFLGQLDMIREGNKMELIKRY